MIGRPSIICEVDHEWDPVGQCFDPVVQVDHHPEDLLSGRWVDQVEVRKCPRVALQVQWVVECNHILHHCLDSTTVLYRQPLLSL